MKKYIIALLLALPLLGSHAQTTYSVERDGDQFAIPVRSTIGLDAKRGFVVTLDKKEYEFPLSSKFLVSDEEARLPLAVRYNQWWCGYSSGQSNSNSIIGDTRGKFYWGDTNINWSIYSCSGTVLDSVANVSMAASGHTRDFGDAVDLVYYDRGDGKVGALILAYGQDAETGKRLNNAVGVDYWYGNLTDYTGVSGKVYEGLGKIQYFDDLETAKDITQNMAGFSQGAITNPTWQFLSPGTTYKGRYASRDSVLRGYGLGCNVFKNRHKPTQANLDAKQGCIFETPDSTNAIVNFYYKTTLLSTDVQFPQLAGSSGNGNINVATDNCTWMGSTCVYLVPWNGSEFKKYAKYKGYLYVVMADGAEYRKYFEIAKKTGVINNTDSAWVKTKDATIPLLKEHEDNGEFHYTNLKYMLHPYNVTEQYGDNVRLTYKEAYDYEHSLAENTYAQLFVKVDAYVPFSLAKVIPQRKMHTCNFSFRANNSKYLSSEIQDKGVLLHIADELSFKANGYDDGFNSWMFTDKDGRIVAYTTTFNGSLSAVEWYE